MQKLSVFTTKKWIYFLLVLLSFVLYGNTILNDYGFDDFLVVSENKYVQKGTAGIQEILDKPYAVGKGVVLDRRPIVLITYALEHQYFGDNPHVSHFINILLYALSLIVLYKVLTTVFQLDKVYTFLPFLATVFFAVHPLHTEVVASLKNRDELLVLLFGLFFVLYGYYFSITAEKKRWWYAVLSLFFFALTLLSKISGFIFLGIFILTCIYHKVFKNSKWNYAFIAVCIFMVYKAWLRVAENLYRTTSMFENPLEENKDLLIAIGTASKITLYHIKMLIVPFPLRFYYGYNVFTLNGINNPLAIFSIVFHVSLFIYGAYRLFKKDILGLIILCYFVSIALYTNFPIPYTGMFSERALLVSSLWFILIIALMVVRLFNSKMGFFNNSFFKKATLFSLIGLFAVYSYLTISRNFQWKNNLTLMSHDIEHLEKSVLANFIYANNLKKESKNTDDKLRSEALATKALYYYQQAIDLAPNYPEFYFKKGSTYRYNLKNLDSAETYFGYAISIDTLYRDANYELSKLFFDKQEFRKSFYFFGKTYAINPKDSLTLFYYAQSAANIGDMATCYKINQEFLNLYPTLQYPYMNLGTYYSTVKKDDSAVIYFEKAIELGAREPQLLRQMSVYFKNKNNPEKSEYYLNLLKNK